MTKKLNLAIIGINRGKLLIDYSKLNNDINIIIACDIDDKLLNSIPESILKTNNYQELTNLSEIDAVYIATPPESHSEISAYFLRKNTSVLCEVPACLDEKEANELRKSIKGSSAIYMMAENYCYIPENLTINEIIRSGKLGEIVFVEGKYIHDCKEYFIMDGSLTWRGRWNSGNKFNHYPTHSLGPICQWLGIGSFGDDAIATIKNSTTSNWTLKKDWEEKNIKNISTQGDIVFSQIKTKNNTTIHLRYDTKSNRPNLKNGYEIQGTHGWIQSGRIDEEESIVFYKKEGKSISLKDTLEYSDSLNNMPFDYKKLGKIAVNFSLFYHFIESIKTKKSKIPLEDSIIWSSPIWRES